MGWTWRESDLRPGDLVDAAELNRELERMKGELSGGMDRDNIPDSVVTAAKVANRAALDYWVVDGITLQSEYHPAYTGGVSETAGVPYDEYVSGWVTNEDDYLEEDMIDGSLHLEMDVWFWVEKDNAHLADKWCQFRLLIDGQAVLQTDKLFPPMYNARLVGDFPIATGSHSVKLAWRMASPEGTETPSDRVFFYGGGKILAINRYR